MVVLISGVSFGYFLMTSDSTGQPVTGACVRFWIPNFSDDFVTLWDTNGMFYFKASSNLSLSATF